MPSYYNYLECIQIDSSYIKHTSWEYGLYEVHFLGTIKEYNDTTYRQVPKIIYDNYLYRRQLEKSGKACFGVGIITSLVGGILLGVGSNSKNKDNIIIGGIFTGIGGTFLSVGIPLWCFGDNLKRTANMCVCK